MFCQALDHDNTSSIGILRKYNVLLSTVVVNRETRGAAWNGNAVPKDRWGPVYGELLTLDNPETRLPAIDRLEGFLPGGPSLYRRVLVPTIIHGVIVSCLALRERRATQPPCAPLVGLKVAIDGHIQKKTVIGKKTV